MPKLSNVHWLMILKLGNVHQLMILKMGSVHQWRSQNWATCSLFAYSQLIGGHCPVLRSLIGGRCSVLRSSIGGQTLPSLRIVNWWTLLNFWISLVRALKTFCRFWPPRRPIWNCQAQPNVQLQLGWDGLYCCFALPTHPPTPPGKYHKCTAKAGSSN